MLKAQSFKPHWVSPPCDTIRDVLKEQGVSVELFAEKMNLSEENAYRLFSGELRISPTFAKELAKFLGGSERFWVNRDIQYQEDMRNLNALKDEKLERALIKSIPLKYMIDRGWIHKGLNAQETLRACLDFFAVKDAVSWYKRYADMVTLAAYRTSPSFEPNIGAVAAWLRQGEIQSKKATCKQWDPEIFRIALGQAKSLVRKKDPKVFIPELIQLCAESGVALVILRTPPGCQASGATKFITPNRAMMLLSFRYLSDDQFWFTFFHEAGHLLLHEPTAVFLEEIRKERTITTEEKEANDFAVNFLIPSKLQNMLRTMPLNKKSIVRIAVAAKVSPGIIIGQLQHLGRVKFSNLNAYKRRYNWEDIENFIL